MSPINACKSEDFPAPMAPATITNFYESTARLMLSRLKSVSLSPQLKLISGIWIYDSF